MCVGRLTLAEQTASGAWPLSMPSRPQDARPPPQAGTLSRMLQRPGFSPHKSLPVRQDGRPKARSARVPNGSGRLTPPCVCGRREGRDLAIRALKRSAKGRFAPGVLADATATTSSAPGHEIQANTSSRSHIGEEPARRRRRVAAQARMGRTPLLATRPHSANAVRCTLRLAICRHTSPECPCVPGNSLPTHSSPE